VKKLAFLLPLALLGACNYKSHTIPGAPIPLASANWSLMGATSAEACGTYIFGIDFGHLFKNRGGSASSAGGDPLAAILGMLPIGTTPEASRALYDAMEKMPEATNLYAPKVHTTVTGIVMPFVKAPLFGERCAQVEARGVKLGDGPVPNAQ
jgi:hypothetical protein